MAERKFTNRPELMDMGDGWEKPFYFRTAAPGEQAQAGTGIITNPETGEPMYPSIEQQIERRKTEMANIEADQKFDRRAFRKEVFNVLGGNPFMMDPNQALTAANKNLPALFNHIFQGKIAWADIGKMTKDQRAYWEEVKKAYRAKKYGEAKSQRDKGIEQYKFMMGEFDAEKRDYEAQRTRAEKAPDRIRAVNPKGKMTWWERDKSTGAWRDTGMVAELPKTSGEGGLGKIPDYARQAFAIMGKLKPELTDRERMLYSMMSKEQREDETVKNILGIKKLTPEEQKQYDQASELYQKGLNEAYQEIITKPKEATKKKEFTEKMSEVMKKAENMPYNPEKNKGEVKPIPNVTGQEQVKTQPLSTTASEIKEKGIVYERAPDQTLRRKQ